MGEIKTTSETGIIINKEIALKGAQAGNDARYRDLTNETIIKGGTSSSKIL